MRRFFILLFILSLGATAATFAWRTFLPEGAPMVARTESAAPATRGADRSLDASPRRSYAPGGEKAASERQDWAVTISILSSVISALAAVVQTWLTARAMPPAGRVGD